ncbi:MAG TPA: hypothetical protein VHC22_09835 [Pirellulales bacterium]|nr:hypothetical protein [Pirellulales bacterium]
MAHSAGDACSSFDREATSQNAKDVAEEALRDLQDRAAEYLERGREQAFAVSDAVEEQIRTRPVQAVTVAAGIGFVLGYLWTRRS